MSFPGYSHLVQKKEILAPPGRTLMNCSSRRPSVSWNDTRWFSIKMYHKFQANFPKYGKRKLFVLSHHCYFMLLQQDKQKVVPILKSGPTEEEDGARRWQNERAPVSWHNKRKRKTTEYVLNNQQYSCVKSSGNSYRMVSVCHHHCLFTADSLRLFALH